MTATTIYAIEPSTGCVGIGSTDNAWKSAMYIWDFIARERLGIKKPFISLSQEEMSKVWNAGVKEGLSVSEKIVLITTMDYITVPKNDVPRVIDALRDFGTSHPRSSFLQQAEIIERHYDFMGESELIAWSQNSISGFLFYDDLNETGEMVIKNLEKKIDIFDGEDL